MFAPGLLFIKLWNLKKENPLILYVYVNAEFSDCRSSVKLCFPAVTYDGGRQEGRIRTVFGITRSAKWLALKKMSDLWSYYIGIDSSFYSIQFVIQFF